MPMLTTYRRLRRALHNGRTPIFLTFAAILLIIIGCLVGLRPFAKRRPDDPGAHSLKPPTILPPRRIAPTHQGEPIPPHMDNSELYSATRAGIS